MITQEEKQIVAPVVRLMYSDHEAAAALGISRAFFLQLLKSGRIDLPVFKFGSRRLYSVKSIESWVLGGCKPNMEK